MRAREGSNMPRKPTGKPVGRPRKKPAEQARNAVAIRLTDDQLRRLRELEARGHTARGVFLVGVDSLSVAGATA
jgi:hypothetical protein